MLDVYGSRNRGKIFCLLTLLGAGDGDLFVTDKVFSEKMLFKLLSQKKFNRVFLPSSSSHLEIPSSTKCVFYGNRLEKLEEGLYSLKGNYGVLFHYFDDATAELAFAAFEQYGIPLEKSNGIRLPDIHDYEVHSKEELSYLLSGFPFSSRVWCFCTFCSGFSYPLDLAGYFCNVDFLVLKRTETKEEKNFLKSLDRIMFSPVVRRLSCVYAVDDFSSVAGLPALDDLVANIFVEV